MIRIDMSEYMEKHTVSRLTGPPPGYIGYESGGQLTEAVRRSPHSVVLLDEIEKAHEDVLNILLQIMEDGILTDGKGRTVNFKNTVLVMTSNVGSRRILEVCRSGSRLSESEAKAADTVKASSGRTLGDATTVVGEKLTVDPMQPEDVLRRMQNNPQAASLLMQASSDPEIMGAIRTAMSGSPADLRAAAQKSPAISKFLQDVWGALSDDEDDENVVVPAPNSGLDAIRSSVQETISQWDDSETYTFATGLIDQLDTSSSSSSLERKDHALYPRLIEVVKEELEAAMKPELLNRIDEIVVFSPLSSADLSLIARLNIAKIVARASEEHSMDLQVSPDLTARIVHEGSANADQFGARPMRRAAQRYVEDALSDAIIQGFLASGDKATLSLAPPHLDGKDRVLVSSKGETLEVEIEDASGGIGSAPRKSSDDAPVNGSAAATLLRTELEQ